MKNKKLKLLFLIVAILIGITSLVVSFSPNETSCGILDENGKSTISCN